MDVAALTPKGRRTRERIIVGARRAFERTGNYVDTRITDITREAKVAYGSFYTYFDSKEVCFDELANEVVTGMYAEGTSSYRGPDPLQRVQSANENFIAAYESRARMMAVIEQVATLNPEFQLLRRQLRDGFVRRIEANIMRWQVDGLATGEVDTHVAAHALVSMTDNFCYVWLVLGEPIQREDAVATLTHLWVNALQLRSP